MKKIKNSKLEKGQYFTYGNPFIYKLFLKWFKLALTNSDTKILLEPFAGSNNIVNLINSLNPKKKYNWICYDIEPESYGKNVSKIPIIKRDVFSNFPKNFNIIITNPPYLAKNSATKKGISFKGDYDDLYKISLDIMLKNSSYVAAIIPESFIMQNLFHDRLYGVISLTKKMFIDTDYPVCLALFIPKELKRIKDNFLIYSNDKKIGDYNKLKKYIKKPKKEYIELFFNSPSGEIAVINIDNTKDNSIKFLKGENIESSKIKESNRNFTRISGFSKFNEIEINEIIKKSNEILNFRREQTSDVFMTAFKGLRKDGKYRRRLDFIQIREIINLAIKELNL